LEPETLESQSNHLQTRIIA